MTFAETRATEPFWRLRLPSDRTLLVGERPLVVGILNITPDSFSDGGMWIDPGPAVARALAMLEEGADLIDLGAESTRPGGGVYGTGGEEIPADVERARLLPVLMRLRGQTRAPLSVDTQKGEVAREALDAGADFINDVSALADPLMGEVVAKAGCPLVLMHSRGERSTMQESPQFKNLLVDVREDLRSAVGKAKTAGIETEQIVLDPGIGFGKTAQQSLALLRNLSFFRALGRPILVGASRKSFVGEVSGATVESRLPGSLAAVAWAMSAGTQLLRVHDVAETVQFVKVFSAIESADQPS